MAVKGLNFNLGARITGQSAFSSFQRALASITAAGNSAKASMRGVSDGVKSAADSASVFGPLLDNVDRINRAFGESVNKIHGVGREMRSAADSASVFQNEFNRLQAKFNPAAAQVRQVENAIAELTRAHMLGAVSAEQYAVELVRLKNNLQTVTAAQRVLVPATNSIGAAADQANRNMGSWNRGLSDTRRAVQAAGFQINDFFLQVAGGQNIVLAFTQQAGQLVQFFGAWGSVAGAALAIGGALWLMFGQGVDSMKKAEDALREFDSALSSALNNVTLATTDVAELAKTYGQFADEVKRAAQESMAFDLSKALSALRDGAFPATAALSEVYDQLRLLKAMQADKMVPDIMTADQLALVDGLAASMGVSAAQAEQLYLAIGKFNQGGTFAEMRDSAQVVVDMLGQMYAGNTKIPPEIQKMKDEYYKTFLMLNQIVGVQDGTAAAASKAADEAAGLAVHMQNIGDWALQANNNVAGFQRSMSSAVGTSMGVAQWAQMAQANVEGAARAADDLANTNMAYGISVAAGWAQTLWTRLSNAAAQARAIAANSALAAPGTMGNLSWQYEQYGIGRTAAAAATNPLYNAPAVPDAAGGGGGGGGTSPIEQLRQDYAKLMADMSPIIASTQQFRDATAAAMAAFETGNVDGVKAAIAAATDVAKEFKSVADSIAQAFMSAFSGVLKGTKSVKDAATDMLNSVLDKTIELLMMPVFEGIAGFVSKGIFGAVGGLGTLPSFDGGGSTGGGARSGGLDGKGGFLSIMHPKESVTDHTRGGGQGGGVTINVIVDGATGNSEIMEMISAGVSNGLKYYDSKVLPQSLQRVSANPRRK